MASWKSFRKLRGKGLRQLSRESGISLATLQRIERGQIDPRLSTLRALSEALEVPISQLLGEGTGNEVSVTINRGRTPMSKKDDVQTRNAAVAEAVKALWMWHKKYVAEDLWEDHIWNYEYNQVTAATKLVQLLLNNLKGSDSRGHEG